MTSLRLFSACAFLLCGAGSLPAQDAPKAVPLDLEDQQGNYAPLPDKANTDAHLRLQIYLDENNFGPGKLDGAIGEFGKKAASVYNQIRGIPVGNYYSLLRSSEKAVPEPYTTYKVQKSDLKFVTPNLSSSPAGQAKQKYMGYRSLLELVSERYHTSEEFLQKINGKNLYNLQPGVVLKVPNVTPFELNTVPVHNQFKGEEPMVSHSVVVDIRARVAIFFDNENKPIASFPITPGESRFIQFGEWKISNMVTTPEFRWDKQMLEAGKRSTEYYQLPIGPNSPVGIMWAGTTRSGIGLHGTSSPHTIGRSESHGCIRLANWDAVRLPTLIRPGSRVIIR